MDNFVTRLQQQRGLIAYGTPYTGELCRHNVYLTIDGANQRFAVKLIQNWNTGPFRCDLNVIQYFVHNPFPDGTYIYRDMWTDVEGIAIKMDTRGGTLRQHINGDTQLGEHHWAQIIYGIACRMEYIHSLNVAHGDLKPSNVLIDLTPNGDFYGAGIFVSDIGIQYQSRVQTSPSGFVDGTLSYLAPERFANQPFTPQSDMWAVGCIAYEICIGRQLSLGVNRQAIDNYIHYAQPLDLSATNERFSDHVRWIIQRCLTMDPTQRMTATELRQHIESYFAQ